MPICNICEEVKDPMDMNRPDLCKRCWSIQRDIKHTLIGKSSRIDLATRYISMRKAYIKAGNKLEQVNETFLKIMAEMEKIKAELTKGWGYKK